MPPPRPTAIASRRRFASERGSMLLTAMLFATGIALVLGSYLALSRTTLKTAHRTFFASDATNLAEAGVEEALYSFNLMAGGTAPATAWSGWTFSSTNAMRTLTPFNRDQNAVGTVKIYVKGYDGSDSAPVIYSQAVIAPFDGGAPVVKTVQLTIKRNAVTVTPGIVGINGVALKGQSFVDSFNSNPTAKPTGPWLPYSAAIATSSAAVGVVDGKITVASGIIKGDLYLGADVSAPKTSDYTGTIHTGYAGSFPLPVYPTTSSVSQSYTVGASIPAVLPVTGHKAASDGRYYYFCSNTTIGTVSIAAGAHVTIVGTNTDMGPGMSIPSTSSCYVYMDGEVTLTKGADLNNAAWAGALKIYTSTTKTCKIGNDSQIVCCLYAPKADLSATGGSASGMLIGSFIADTITASGSMDFHYDLALGPSSGATGYDPTKWLVLDSATDRAAVAGLTGSYLR